MSYLVLFFILGLPPNNEQYICASTWITHKYLTFPETRKPGGARTERKHTHKGLLLPFLCFLYFL